MELKCFVDRYLMKCFVIYQKKKKKSLVADFEMGIFAYFLLFFIGAKTIAQLIIENEKYWYNLYDDGKIWQNIIIMKYCSSAFVHSFFSETRLWPLLSLQWLQHSRDATMIRTRTEFVDVVILFVVSNDSHQCWSMCRLCSWVIDQKMMFSNVLFRPQPKDIQLLS